MPDEIRDAIGKILRRAISDPGSYAGERRVLHEGWAGPEYESLTFWQARAVLAALGGEGYGIARTEATVTEWEVRNGEHVMGGYSTGCAEDELLEGTRYWQRRGVPAALWRRQVTPWTEVPVPAKENADV